MFSAVLCVLFILAGSGCDSGGSQPDPDPEVTVSAEAVTENGSRVDSAGIYFDGQKVGEGTAQKTYTQDSDGSVTVSAQEDDYLSAEKTVSLGADREVSLELQEELPETVTISFENRAADGDSLVAGDLELAGTVVAENKMSGSFSASGSRETKQLCFVEQNFFDRSCADLTPTSDQSVELRPERKQVTVATTPKDSTGAVIPDASTWIYEPFGSDSTEIEDEGSVELPKRSGEREFRGDWITQEPNSSKLDRYRSTTMTVSAAENVDEDIVIDQLIPACSDNINNDSDNAIDEEDIGCANDSGDGYDPDDDNETHYLRQRVTGVNFEDSVYVSGRPDERKVEIVESDFPESVTVAIGEVRHRFRNKRLPIENQDFRMKIQSKKCSASDYSASQESEVVADPDTATGWKNSQVHGFTRFEGGRCYKLWLKKAEPVGGPENKALHFDLTEDSGLHTYLYYFEKDHPELQDESNKAVMPNSATLKNGECTQIENGTICKNAGNPAPPWMEY